MVILVASAVFFPSLLEAYVQYSFSKCSLNYKKMHRIMEVDFEVCWYKWICEHFNEPFYSPDVNDTIHSCQLVMTSHRFVIEIVHEITTTHSHFHRQNKRDIRYSFVTSTVNID